MTKINKIPTQKKIFSSIFIIGIIWVSAMVIAFFISIGAGSGTGGGNIAVIPIDGEISVSGSGTFTTGVSSESVVAQLDRAEKDPSIKAVLLDINSPGGSAVASDEIGQKIKESTKPTVAVIREVGASGGYWIASTADYIVANRLSLTGSIGVIGSYLDFSGFLQEHNITYQRFVSGEYKDMGSPYKEPTPEEAKLWQQTMDKIKVYFVEEVANNRNLSVDDVDKMATGQVYLGSEAKDLGLVDELGTKEDAYKHIENQLNITAHPVDFVEHKSLLDMFSQVLSQAGFKIGKFINPGQYKVLLT